MTVLRGSQRLQPAPLLNFIVRSSIDIGGSGERHNDQLSREGRHRLVSERLPRVCCRFRRRFPTIDAALGDILA
jgi:hypothetical protein